MQNNVIYFFEKSKEWSLEFFEYTEIDPLFLMVNIERLTVQWIHFGSGIIYCFPSSPLNKDKVLDGVEERKRNARMIIVVWNIFSHHENAGVHWKRPGNLFLRETSVQSSVKIIHFSVTNHVIILLLLFLLDRTLKELFSVPLALITFSSSVL